MYQDLQFLKFPFGNFEVQTLALGSCEGFQSWRELLQSELGFLDLTPEFSTVKRYEHVKHDNTKSYNHWQGAYILAMEKILSIVGWYFYRICISISTEQHATMHINIHLRLVIKNDTTTHLQEERYSCHWRMKVVFVYTKFALKWCLSSF